MITVLDIGTSSMRCCVVDNLGKINFTSQKEYNLIFNENNCVEFDPIILKDSINHALKEVMLYCKEKQITLSAICVTSQRSSVIPVDKNCIPLHNAIMWQDTRANYICERMQEHNKTIYNIGGVRLSPVFSAPKILLLKEQFENIYNKAFKTIGFLEYALYQLSETFITDTSIAGRTALFDIANNTWSDKLINIFGIDKTKLCDVAPVGSIIGKTCHKINTILNLKKPIPVITAGGDQQCAALGLGCINSGDIEINSGTGSYVIAISDKPLFDKKLRTMCNGSAIEGKYIVEGTIINAGKAVNWVNDEFFKHPEEQYPFENFTLACNNSTAGANGVIFKPNFTGTGTPDWNYNARAGITNLSFFNTKKDFARAVLEGIASNIANTTNCINEISTINNLPIKIAGGLTKNACFNQSLSSMLNRQLEITGIKEATVIGAWISCAVATGIYTNHEKAYNAIQKQKIIINPINTDYNLYKSLHKTNF